MTLFQVDDLAFDLRRSSRRKTLEITVDRGGELVLSVPAAVGEETIRAFVREKRYWVFTKLAEKAQLQRAVTRKEMVDGEGFLYLGRSYRLRLVDEQPEPLKLSHGWFQLRRDAVADGRSHFIHWYTERGGEWVTRKVREHAARMEASPVGVKVQDLGYRWGSCGKGGWLYFHWKTMLLPRTIAEYVVIHELAHLHEPHHTPAFWRCIERAMPDYEQRKQWLAGNGVEVEGL